MKTCCICKAEKPLDQYYKKAASRDGLMAACKACHLVRHRRSVAKKPEHYRATAAAWKKENPMRIARCDRDWRAANRDKLREIRRARAYRDRHNPATRPKVLARQRVKAAIRRGKLERRPCEKCGATDRVHAHHPDYARPMDVVWLCHACHIIEHGGTPRLLSVTVT